MSPSPLDCRKWRGCICTCLGLNGDASKLLKYSRVGHITTDFYKSLKSTSKM